MTDISDVFRLQGVACAELGSPFMGQLMPLIADRLRAGTAVADLILNWDGDPAPSADSVPLRFAGALHDLARSGAALAEFYPPARPDDDTLWAAVADAMVRHEAVLLQWMTSAPQTNEVRRAAAIVPALHMVAGAVAMPVSLMELGASAGLNLRCDRFCVQAGDVTFGPRDSGVQIAPNWDGPVPAPASVDVVARAGVDLNPIDPATDAGKARLLAYLWPDQPDRIMRTDAAIDLARRVGAQMVKADAIDWLSGALTPVPGVARVVYHTVAWQYFPAAVQAAGEALLADAGATATAQTPLARISMEADGGAGAALRVTLWPGGETLELARVDFHGRWVRWVGPKAL
jgi:hypothetical protein